MTDDSHLETLDYSLIQFPTDRISVRDLRRIHPNRFDAGTEESHVNRDPFDYLGGYPDFTLGAAMATERLFARAAYDGAKGMPMDFEARTEFNRRAFVEDLSECYQQYGIATGIHQTEQLIREIETQAVSQVHGPKR